jgi:polar amino acid transport system substrate-binding protein
MTKLMAVGLLFVIAITGATALDNDVAKELAPNGKLRVGVAYAPNSNAVFVTRDAAGDIRGAPRDIGAALAKSIGIPVEFVLAANTGELTELCANGAVDIAFMPADEERRKRLDFSPAYFVIEITYLAAASIDAKTIADVDHSGITVVAISGSATSRAAAGSLKNAKLVTAKSVEEAMEMMKAGTSQAFALGRETLPKLQVQLPGSHIVDGAFQTIEVAISLPKSRPAALAFASNFVKTAKADGTVRRAFDDAGLAALPVAP